ncbi:MAG TPA: 2OG-Fe(II) oxygenase [Sphingomonas sp.]
MPEPAVPHLDGAVNIGATATSLDTAQVDRARTLFAEHYALLLPAAFDPMLLASIMALCRATAFETERVGTIGWRTIEAEDRVGRALRFVLERDAFLRWVETVTGCAGLTNVSGVLAEMLPGTDHVLGWHDDCNDATRRLALIVHLSDAPFEGGRFELTRKSEQRPIATAGYLSPGSILLFRVDPALRHRVTAVEGDRVRRVFAGWLNV